MNDGLNQEHTATNRSLDKAFEILEFLARYGIPLSPPAISRKLNINKVTTYNLLRTMEYHQYLQKSADGKYQLSSKLFELGMLFQSQNPATRFFESCSYSLLKKYTMCNLSLGTYGNSMKGVYLSVLGTNESFVTAGTPFPLHATALGKVLLAYASPEFQSKFFEQENLTRYSSHTITDKILLKRQLQQIRHDGYCILAGDLFTDFYCISVPVFASKQKFIAAISIRGSESFVKENKDILLKDILDMGKRMSINMNYLPLYVSGEEI